MSTVTQLFETAVTAAKLSGYMAHTQKHKWGWSAMIMEPEGCAFCRVYRYKGYRKSIYLDWLSVRPESQKGGMGSLLLNAATEIGFLMNADYVYLWTTRGTWVHKWYTRKGFCYFMDKEHEDNAIWLRAEVL